MADKWAISLGLKRSKNPSAIANDEHDDKSLSARNLSGSPGTANAIISTAATAQLVPAYGILRVMNTSATVQYLFIGIGADIPAGTPDITNGLAIAPNSYECFFLGTPLSMIESVWIKASANTVQVVVFEQ